MEVEQTARPNSESEKKAKENSSAAGNHGDTHMNGMSNGFDRKKEHKSERKDKERSHKSEHRDKDRKDKEKSHKSEHKSKDRDKDKEKDKDRHKDKHSSSNGSSSKDKDKDKDKDKEHRSSSSVTKDKERDKDKKDHHKSSLSSKDKDKHHSSSKTKDSKDKERSKDKDRHHHESSRDKEKDKTSSKDKDRRHSSSSKDKDRHSTSHSSSNDKDKSRSDKDRHRHDKDKDRHRRDKDKDKKSREDRDKGEVKEEIVVKEEEKSQVYNDSQAYEEKPLIKDEPVSQVPVAEDEDDSNSENGLCINEDDGNDAADRNVKREEEDEDEDYKQEQNSMNSSDANDTRLSDLHNTTLKTEEESDEDLPLSVRKPSQNSKRKVDSSDDEDDVPLVARKKTKKEVVKKKKKRKHSDDEEENDYEEVKSKSKKKKTAAKPVNNASPRKKKKDEEETEVWKWWEEEKKSDGTKWTFLEHKGPVFAPEYEPLPPSVKFYYNGKEMRLTEPTEEVATFYARMLEHDYTTKKIFNDNFFKDWREVMSESERKTITDLSKCNFRPMHDYFIQKSEERKAMTKEEKKALKEKNDEITKEYGFCTIDGHKEKIGNFKIEPPGLFRGRGEHPKMGKLKKRVMPEDVLINCSKNSVIPKPPPGHKWREVRHDPTVTWLASWTENVQGQVKYVMLNPSSKLKGEKDWQKYETARKLAKSIDKIRAEYREDWKSKEMRIRQRAVALYFIDKLALRAGNEKDEDQADTVGCCSLRVEHITLHEQKDGKEFVVVFDFLGKDSIRYYNEVPVEKRVFKNLQLFKENKSDGDDLFDRLNTAVLNKHLTELMDGLTAKVFRTYNASWTLQQQLDELTDPEYSVAEKILAYNRANRAVAILCNHQRSVPKGHDKSMENLNAKIEAKKEAIKEAEGQVKDTKREAKHGSMKAKDAHDKAKKKLEKLKEQLTKLEVQRTDRDENKAIALGTSKLNYLDPRITVAWCKKNDVPIEKIYNKTQRDKFRWAIDMAGPDYVF
ncbi:DNA topoisomerase I, mitochondrial isoform X3 [Cotesia glomerata]|uniref:DNA topoisomerase I, mitochondrial isoform X3 n=1 Tax=Cotesia glomerata TaxID=32391 RepID=UPI001D0185C5|nr:DNA topoisomerase I, mitochondrial isoform X3 [Cotesia glomerata]